MTKLAISSGHGLHIRGASGYPVPPQLDEVDEARRVVDRVTEILNSMDGVSAVKFHDNTSYDQSTNLATITNWHNAQTRDYDVSVHFNAYDGSAHGCEVLYVTQQSLAGRLSSAMSTAGHFTNRGAKYRSDLYVLNNTEMPAVLLETCFCDNTGDSTNYNANFEAICTAIAEELSGQKVPDQPPIEPPVEPPGETPSEEARVIITSRYRGDVMVIVNDTVVHGTRRCANVVDLKVSAEGNVVISVNGEEFHNQVGEPDEPGVSGPTPNHCDIETTVFGGAGDPNNSAYPPYGYLNDTDLYVALPYSFDPSLFPDNPPKIRVYHGELSAVARVADKGPWTTDDWEYVMSEARPIAETCHDEGAPLPSGPNAGKVPTNRAGLDLSPALAEKIGLEGKGFCDWEWVNEDA